MKSYMLYDWNGQMKWADVQGVYLVDYGHAKEFLAQFPEARKLPANMLIVG